MRDVQDVERSSEQLHICADSELVLWVTTSIG